MKSTSIYSLISLLFVGNEAFSPTITNQRTCVSSSLGVTIIKPPDDDNCELEGSDCEESVFARKKREKKESEQNLRDVFVQNGLNLRDIDRQESVDQVSYTLHLSMLLKSYTEARHT